MNFEEANGGGLLDCPMPAEIIAPEHEETVIYFLDLLQVGGV